MRHNKNRLSIKYLSNRRYRLKGRIKLFYTVLFFLLTSMVQAQENTISSSDFNIDKTKIQLETIKLHLKKNQIKYNDLEKVRGAVSDIESHAKICIKQNTKELSQLNALSTGTSTQALLKTIKKTDDYLDQAKNKTRQTLADCNLLLYEAKKLKKAIDRTTHDNKSSYNFLKTAPLWDIQDKSSLFALPQYDFSKLYQRMGFKTLLSHQIISELLIRILFYLSLAYFAYRFVSHFFKKNTLTKQLLKPLRMYLPLILVFSMSYLYLTARFNGIYPAPLLSNILKHLSYFFGFLLFIKINYVLFSYKKKPNSKHAFYHVIQGATVLAVAFISHTFLYIISPAEITKTTTLSAYILIYLIFIVTVFIWTLNHSLQLILKYKYCSHLQYRLIKGVNILFFSGLIISVFFGYGAFSSFVIDHTIKTYLLLFVSFESIYLIWTYAHVLNDKTAPLCIRFHRWAGLKPKKILIEVSILKFLLTLILMHYFIQLFVTLWDMPGYYLTSTLDFLESGLYLFNMQINLLAIFRGLTVFCFIIISGRLLGAFFARKNTNFEQKNARITIVTLTNYLAFIMGALISLMVIGINLSGFALVASALSVGIGFGLKGIAADLISGLILLLSKPLRPGDYIEIKEVEGFISKIRLLSTEIRTLSKTNIILPNSFLLSQSVTNYTYKNKLTRSTTYIMLEDAADVKRTKKIMLDVAKKHPDVHQEKDNQPEVIVDLRPDKSAMHIVLTLWCIIKDADNRYRINSDINAKVLAAVEKAKIPLKL
ncbi:MAG: mechanosensitive ion channel [Legionella sp.]|nr:mechanosensitive ion channel [Legionella sp.]